MKTEEEIIVKEEAEYQEEGEIEVNVTDIGRHAAVTDFELDELEDGWGEINKLTQKQTLWAMNCFTGWVHSQGLEVNLSTVEKAELNGLLRQFYGSVRNAKGELYGISSYISLRSGLNRYLKVPPICRHICLMKDAEFVAANKIFLGMVKRIRKSGVTRTSNYQALSTEDICLLLRHSHVMDTSTPRGLLNKVWFDIQVHFGRRGKQANRSLTLDSFVIRTNQSQLKYCTLTVGNEEPKIRTEKDRFIMLEKPGSRFCPIASLLKYLSKLPSNPTALYLQPKRERPVLTDENWYSNTPLGVNYLGNMMSRMSKEAGTSVIYTNLCLKNTPFQLLSCADLDERKMITITFHRVESSLQSHQTQSLWVPTMVPTLAPVQPSQILPESSSAGPAPAGLDLNNDDLFEDLPLLQNASNQNYVPDAVLPPGEPWLLGGLGRAELSLPSCLCLCADVGSVTPGAGSSGDGRRDEMKVYAKCHLQKGVMFGPYTGEMCKGLPTNLKYTWAIRDDAAFIYVDAADENKSNWMRFVAYTSSEEDHNLVIFQFYRHVYYRVTEPIAEGAELRVWIGKDYANLLGIGMAGDNSKCEIGDKETALRLLQDIQMVTLPEPSSSSLWSDHSQSQSPMPVISDVGTMLCPEAGNDSGLMSSPGFPPSSLISHPSQTAHMAEKYDFLPGTEKLVSNPTASQNSPWFFYGFEPDPTGRPLDRSNAVCKLCGEHVGCAGGIPDIQSHLTNKHHIKPRDSNKERSLMTLGQQRSQLLMANSFSCMPVTTPPPLVLSPVVTDAIANFLIRDLQPTVLVEGEGFKQLIHTLLPSYKEMPSPSQLENLLKEHHAKGKFALAQLLRRKTANEDKSDYTAPIECEPRGRGRPAGPWKEVTHFVTLSADVWLHSWHGDTERYLTLWAHYIDHQFSFQNMALGTQRLTESGAEDYSLKAVEAQVREMAQEWWIAQPNLVLLGGEGRNKMKLSPKKSSKGGGESVPHPNSTTFLERDDSVSPEGSRGSEHVHSIEGPAYVPCFFSAVQECIEEVMSHSVISKTLGQFQGILSALFLPSAQSKGSYQHHGLFQTLTKQERAELKSWAYRPQTWNKLYPLLSVLVKHKIHFCDVIKEIKEECLSKEDPASESSLSDSFPANSASSTSSIGGILRAEWRVLEELCQVLRPLDVACRTLAKEAFPRLSLIKPILTGLLSRHLVARNGESSILKEVKRMMRRNLASCYDNPAVNKVLCMACALDPQFSGLGFMEEKEQTATFDWLKKEALRIVKEDKRRSQCKAKQSQRKRSTSPESLEADNDFLRRSKRIKESRPINFRELENYGEDIDESEYGDEDNSDVEEVEEMAEPSSQASLSGMEFLLGDLFSSAPKSRQSSVEESLDIEMSSFRADKGASLGVEPLQWWRTKEVQFPLLATVARAYLAAPAVSGNAAQDFVLEGAGATAWKRAHIPPESLDSLLFLHHNHMPAARNNDKNVGVEKLP